MDDISPLEIKMSSCLCDDEPLNLLIVFVVAQNLHIIFVFILITVSGAPFHVLKCLTSLRCVLVWGFLFEQNKTKT